MADDLSQRMSNVSVKSEHPVMHIGDDDANEVCITQMNGGDEADIKPLITIVQVPIPPPIIVEQKTKREERPIKQRSTGKIGTVFNLRRRRLLSVSADRAADYFRSIGQPNVNENDENAAPSVPSVAAPTMRRTNARAVSAVTIIRAIPTQMGQATSSNQQKPRPQKPKQKQPQQKQQQKPQQQQQQKPQQQQDAEFQELVRLMGIETYCVYCRQKYSSLQTLKCHFKSKKHKNSLDATTPERAKLLGRAFDQHKLNRQ